MDPKHRIHSYHILSHGPTSSSGCDKQWPDEAVRFRLIEEASLQIELSSQLSLIHHFVLRCRCICWAHRLSPWPLVSLAPQPSLHHYVEFLIHLWCSYFTIGVLICKAKQPKCSVCRRLRGLPCVTQVLLWHVSNSQRKCSFWQTAGLLPPPSSWFASTVCCIQFLNEGLLSI